MRLSVGYPRTVDRMAWWRLIEHEGWDTDLAWRLLITVEERFAEDAAKKQQQDGDDA